MNRSAVSIPSNIAEGSERESKKEFARYLGIAKGSLAELYTQILIAKKRNYISVEDFTNIDGLIDRERKMIFSLIKNLKSAVNKSVNRQP
jgi:four helix bundle protein